MPAYPNDQAEGAKARKAVWLDCDPGHDDAMALILAAYHDSLELIGVSTVAGNQTVDKTAANACRVLGAAGITHVPVFKGQARAMLKDAPPDDGIHGESGLGGSPLLDRFEANELLHEGKAVIQMAEAIIAHPDPVHLVATGTLTNVALMISLYPEVLTHIEQIVLMGGAIEFGNRSSAAEFNILCDPEAAQIVFTCGLKVVMVPLEVTHTALATEQVLATISSLGTPFARVIVELLTFFRDTYKQVFDFDAPPVHDPCAVAYVVNPSLFKEKLVRVDVDCSPGLCRGRTVCDMFQQNGNGWAPAKAPANVHVTTHMDVPAFWQMMQGVFAKASAASPLKDS